MWMPVSGKGKTRMRCSRLTLADTCRTIRSVRCGIWAKGMRTKPRRVLRWSCKTAGEAFGLIPNRLAVALAKSQDHRSILRGFSFGMGRQGALANGADISRTQERQRCGKPNRSESALIERPAQAWLNVTHRSSHPEESIRQAHLVWEGQKNPPDGAGRKSPVTRWRYA